MNQTFCILLQINDALFPIGSYTQSYGFETYIQKGLVKDGDTAIAYLRHQLETSFLHSELLVARLAYEYTKENKMEKLVELEEISMAARAPMELRLANFKLGNRFMKAVAAMGIKNKTLEEYYEGCKHIGISHAVAYGVFCASLGIGQEEALMSYMYAQTSSNVTNAVKLVPLSQTVGQCILFGCHETFNQLIKRVYTLEECDLFASTPALDVRACQHEVLYSRLYMS